MRHHSFAALRLLALLFLAAPLLAQVGTVSGVVSDEDFGGPVAGARVLCVQTNNRATASDTGNYEIQNLKPGRYTFIFSKPGFVQVVKNDVAVNPGQVTALNVSLAIEVTDMEEFVVQDTIQLTPGSDAALLELRFKSPAILDAIGVDFMRQAGASDAASAMKLIAGASVKDGKSAVVRGLPDRYVSSQINGVRLPTADEDKRAVELDQFPSSVIQEIAVSKTFTPDQQGDASGGAVNVRLRGIPKEPAFFRFSTTSDFNSQVFGQGDFLETNGANVPFWGKENRDPSFTTGSFSEFQYLNLDPINFERNDAPMYVLDKFSLAAGASHEFDNGYRIGGLATFYHERDATFIDNGTDDRWWVEETGGELVPLKRQITGANEYFTALFDTVRSSRSVQWSSLVSFGAAYKDEHSINVNYLLTRSAEEKAILAIDTRGKEFAYPGYDPYDPEPGGVLHPGHDASDEAPYLRLETHEYTERETSTFQIHGDHTIPTGDFGPFKNPKLDWFLAFSNASLDQPDKRVFGAAWRPERVINFHPALPPIVVPARWSPYKGAANFTLGNLQRLWKTITEESDQYAINLTLPFEQWDGLDGSLKFGWFSDSVTRKFDQNSYSNFGENADFEGDWRDPWSDIWHLQDHEIYDGGVELDVDVDYKGTIGVDAWYAMLELPLLEELTLRGGVRMEWTDIGVKNFPEGNGARWFPPNGVGETQLTEGVADVDYSQTSVLPSIALEYRPLEDVRIRGSYNKTIARQTFKELTPIIQQEYLGGPVFIGYPTLEMSKITNYDLRVDYTPFEGGLISASWFYKSLKGPIEYVQVVDPFDYTSPRNYPEGTLNGWELEFRQQMGKVWEPLDGLTLGTNGTLIDSEVTLTDKERADFRTLGAPIDKRDMTQAPAYLFNAFLTYDIKATRTRVAVFYTRQGETLLAGAAEAGGNFVPNVYAQRNDSLNVSLTQQIGEYLRLRFAVKNLTDPKIQTFYKSPYTKDKVRSSFTKGIDYSISLSAEFSF